MPKGEILLRVIACNMNKLCVNESTLPNLVFWRVYLKDHVDWKALTAGICINNVYTEYNRYNILYIVYNMVYIRLYVYMYICTKTSPNPFSFFPNSYNPCRWVSNQALHPSGSKTCGMDSHLIVSAWEFSFQDTQRWAPYPAHLLGFRMQSSSSVHVRCQTWIFLHLFCREDFQFEQSWVSSGNVNS